MTDNSRLVNSLHRDAIWIRKRQLDKVNEETLLAAGLKPKEIFQLQNISKENLIDINSALPHLARQFKCVCRTMAIVVLIPILLADSSELNIALGFTLALLPFISTAFPVRLGYKAWLLNKFKDKSTLSKTNDR